MVCARIAGSEINEAIGTATERTAAPEDIDKAMKLETNYPMGLLESAAHIGLDKARGSGGLCGELGEDHYRPLPRLRTLILADQWGKSRSGINYLLIA